MKTLKFKKYSLLAAMVMICLCALAGCGGRAETPLASAETDKLAVGFDANFPPYGYKEGGEYVGFDIDLAKEVCERRGWEIELRPIDWNVKDMELSSGAIDCIWNGFTINGREDQYTWTKPYVDNSQVVMVNADSGITGLADLAGKTVAVQDDSSAHKALIDAEGDLAALSASFNELKLVPDYAVAFMDLQAGAVDAVALDVGVAKYQMENRDGEFAVLDETLVKEAYGVGFLLGNEALRDQVEESLMEMYEDGTFMEIAAKWNLQDSVVIGG